MNPRIGGHRGGWPGCMDEAVAHQDHPQELRHYYLQQQLRIPAGFNRRTGELG